MKKLIATLILLAVAVLPLQACSDHDANLVPAKVEQAAVVAKPVSPADAEAQAEEGISFEEAIVWVDVRSAEEFAGGALDRAVNIPHTEIADKIVDLVDDKGAPVYLYCRSGNRAGKAKAVLEAIGYTNVVNVGGLQDALNLVDQHH